jgi:rhodanese-related sulfurtransferase
MYRIAKSLDSGRKHITENRRCFKFLVLHGSDYRLRATTLGEYPANPKEIPLPHVPHPATARELSVSSAQTMNPQGRLVNLLGDIAKETKMAVTLVAVCAFVLALVWSKRTRDAREMQRHTITPEALYMLLACNRDVIVFDVREPLDVLVESEIIPGAIRLAPREVRDNPSLLPREKEIVVYCTCRSDESSRAILHRALAAGFVRIKFLKGGLEAWKLKGYPVEPYTVPFHLKTGT